MNADPCIFSPFNVRNSNKLVVLDLIRFTPGGISRADLARKIGLSRSAVTSIVNDLLAGKLVRESENGPATGGRRPILLEINPLFGYVVGIDIGATHLGMVLTDLSAHVLNESEVPFDVARDPETCFAEVDAELRKLCNTHGLSICDLTAIGLGVPGPVIAEAGMLIDPPLMPQWDAHPIKSRMEEKWGCPVSLNNDAELGALGEWAYGAGRGECNLVYIKVGTGVGAGLMMDGRIYLGATGSAGEIGHSMIKDHGPLCSCGNRGCLEAMAGGKAIAERAKRAVSQGQRTQLITIQPIENITARDVAVAARMGDLLAQEIVTEAGEYLGIAIANLINLINPSVVVVGGGVAQMGDLLLEPIRYTAEKRSLQAASQAARITTAVLGRRSTSMGAVAQALTVALYQKVDNLSV
ncbi:MAG: ROK family transcriptional regulator [Anaerolineales bacterium]